MADLFDIGLETDLSEFDSTVTDSGDLSQSGSAALAGTSGGLSVLIDDTNSIYGQMNTSNLTEFRCRFYLDPNGLTMGNNNNFYLIDIGTGDGRLRLKYESSAYKIYAQNSNDSAGQDESGDVTLSDAEHWIEVHWKRSTGPGNDDGFVKIWVDQSSPYGAADAEATGLDDDTRDYDEFRIGAAGSIDAGTSGTFYIDEIKANNDGSEIGPKASAGVVIFRRRRETIGAW